MDLIKYLKNSNCLVIGGHRGQALKNIRENTISAFDTVIGKGIPYIEVDVQLTKDKILVLYHDHDLSIKTALSGMIREYTLDELSENFEICTVEEAIDWAKIHDIGLAFELKLKYPEMKDDKLDLGLGLISILREKNFFRQCFVFAKDLELLKILKEIEARLHIGIIGGDRSNKAVQFMADIKADIYLNFIENLSYALVSKLRASGYLVDGSVINNQYQLDKALALGVNLVESDFPEKIIQLLEASYETSC